MKIVFGHHLSLRFLGGGEKWIISVANELVKRGHDVEIYSTPIKTAGGIPIDNLDELLNGIPYKEKYRHSINGDVCYVTYHPLYGLNFNTKGKLIVGIHATTCWEPIDWGYGFLPIQAKILHSIFGKSELKKADAIHTVAGYLDILHDKVYRIPNFVDENVYIPYKKVDKFTVGYISRKTNQKGWDIFKEIAIELVEKDIDMRISGDISEENLPKFISECHVIVVPSRHDSFGLVIVEALDGNVFVITSNIPSHKYLGLPLYYANSVTEYVNKIMWVRDLWKNYPKQFELMSRGLRDSAMKYSKWNIMNQLENMFIEVGST